MKPSRAPENSHQDKQQAQTAHQNKEVASPFGALQDIAYMNHALRLANKAFANDEVPIGAVVVNADGAIIGRGMNMVEKRHTQTAHAEVFALQRAGAKFGDWRLEGCWLYVTLEPCVMCMALALQSRIKGVVYGAPSPIFGYHLDINISLQLYQKGALTLVEGVGKRESAALLRQFFKTKRTKKG